MCSLCWRSSQVCSEQLLQFHEKSCTHSDNSSVSKAVLEMTASAAHALRSLQVHSEGVMLTQTLPVLHVP